jgi:hypothetical protein
MKLFKRLVYKNKTHIEKSLIEDWITAINFNIKEGMLCNVQLQKAIILKMNNILTAYIKHKNKSAKDVMNIYLF